MKRAVCVCWVWAICCLPLFVLGQKISPSLQQAWLEKFLGELSHDSLEGRATFTPGLDRAAHLIEREFRAAGLAPFAPLTGGSYRQRYVLYRPAVGSAAGRFNGRVLSPEQTVAVGPPVVDLTLAGAPTVERITRGQSLERHWRELVAAATIPTLVLVDSSHAEAFGRLRRRARPTFDRPAEMAVPVVAVLTDHTQLRDLDITVRAGVDSLVAWNLVAVLPGRSRANEWVLFTAHYDHIGILSPANGDSIANGANDDGSGTTAVLALAHHFAREAADGRPPERTLVFACFSGEEMGLWGSQHFARRLAEPEHTVVGFNLEMLGRPSSRGPGTAWLAGWDKSDFGPLLNSALSTSEHADSSFFADPYPRQQFWRRSDHFSLAQLGIPAHMIMADDFDHDPYYHTVDDEVSTLHFEHYATLVQKIARAAVPFVQGRFTPRRITKP